MGYGMNCHLGVSFQNSFGTSNVDSMHYFPIISESLVHGIPDLMSEAARGRYEAGPSYQNMYEYGGDIVFDGHPILLGKMMKAWFGGSSATLSGSSYIHTFKPATQDFCNFAAVPPMSIEIYRDAGSAHLFSDACCNQLTIEILHGQIVKATAGVVGANRTKISKSTPSYLQGSDYIFNQASFSFQGSQGGGIDLINAFTITMNNNIEPSGTLNTTLRPSRIKRAGFRSIDISGTMLFENDNEYDHFLNAAHQRMVAVLTGQDIGSGGPASMTFDFPEVRYGEFPPNHGGPGLIQVSFSATAKYNAGSGTMAEFTLVNTLSNY